MSNLNNLYNELYNTKLESHQREWLDSMLGGDTVILGARRIGKTFVSALAAVLLGCGINHKGSKIKAADVVIISKDLRTAQEMIREVDKHASAFNAIEKITHDKRGSVTSIWLKTGKKIMAMPGLPKSGRGLGGHVIVDEFAHNEADPNELYAMATTIPSSHNHLRTIILTNADYQNSWTENFLYSQEKEWEALRTGFSILSTPISHVYPTPDDYPEKIKTQWQRLPTPIWQREYECLFVSGGDSPFDVSLLTEEEIFPHQGKVVLSYDPGWTTDPAGWVVSIMASNKVSVIDGGMAWGQSEQSQRDTIRNLVEAYGVQTILVDPGTAGFTLAANLEREYGSKVIKTAVNSKRYGEWSRELAVAMNEGRVSIKDPKIKSMISSQLLTITEVDGKINVPKTRIKDKMCHQDVAVALLMSMSMMGRAQQSHRMLPRYDLGVRRGIQF